MISMAYLLHVCLYRDGSFLAPQGSVPSLTTCLFTFEARRDERMEYGFASDRQTEREEREKRHIYGTPVTVRAQKTQQRERGDRSREEEGQEERPVYNIAYLPELHLLRREEHPKTCGRENRTQTLSSILSFRSRPNATCRYDLIHVQIRMSVRLL
ncbi:hypothetical protein GQ53DRAFT_362389 [Thozetella sp. PMI_491]|nr:hypothetical protein GQ53DRAFT_362389 [Thozetella sp. PMI_491]